MQSYAKRYEGHEQEILRDIKVHGRFGAMTKWGAHVIPWEKFINELEEIPDGQDTPENPLRVDDLFGVNRQSLAEQLVEQFTHKVVTLENRCREQESRITFLEKQLAMYKDRNDERLADKMVKALTWVNEK